MRKWIGGSRASWRQFSRTVGVNKHVNKHYAKVTIRKIYKPRHKFAVEKVRQPANMMDPFPAAGRRHVSILTSGTIDFHRYFFLQSKVFLNIILIRDYGNLNSNFLLCLPGTSASPTLEIVDWATWEVGLLFCTPRVG